MKKLLLIVLILFACDALSSSFLFANNLSLIDTPYFDPDTGEPISSEKEKTKFELTTKESEKPDSLLLVKDKLYLKKKKSSFAAGMLSLFLNITGSGHLYAGDGNMQIWARSIPFSLLTMLSKTKLIEQKAPDLFGFFVLGMIYDSIKMVEIYNIRLHNSIYQNKIKTEDELKDFELQLDIRQSLYSEKTKQKSAK
tara:strand:- start:701 stop:1288 length:588 start_codon:yes stop_codon:yes gene_type:complete